MGIFKSGKKPSSAAASPREGYSAPKDLSPGGQEPSVSSARGSPLLQQSEEEAKGSQEPTFLGADDFRELTQKLGDTKGDYAESTQCSSTRSTELRYAKFTLGGFQGMKHAVFVPDHLKLTPSIMEQICRAIDKEVPSMLLRGMGSICHPAKMSTPQLRKCRGLRQLMNEARSTLGLPGDQQVEDGSACCCRSQAETTTTEVNIGEAEQATLIDVANRVLEKKIAYTVRSVANAALRANAWTLTGPAISSFEVFLQQCLDNGETDVFRMTVAHLQDKAYMESETSRNLSRYLFENSQSMSPEVVHHAAPVNLSGDLWNPSKSTNREFAEHGFEFWSFESYDDDTCKGHPVGQWPWPFADLFLFFYREDQTTSAASTAGQLTGASTSDADWEYTTRRRFEREAIPFTPELLAPVGYVFIGNGEAQTKKKLLQAIRMSNPVVLVDNTPSVPKQASLFVNAVKKVWERAPLIACSPFMAEGARSQFGASPSSTELIEAMLPSKIMNYVEQEFDNSGMEEGEKMTLSDIVGLLDLVKRRPQAFKESVCAVDPLHHSPEHITSSLISAMTSHHTGARERQMTAVHRSLVMKAWRLHRNLACRARQLRDADAALVVIAALVMVLSTTLAIWVVSIRLERAKVDDVTYNMSAPVWTKEIEISFTMSDELGFSKFFLLVLPILAGLLTTVHSHFALAQKWASMHMASVMTVSEIYLFLGTVGPYTGSPSVNQKRLMMRLQTIARQLSLSGVHEEDLMGSSSEGGEDFPQDLEALEDHVNEHLYGIRPTSWLFRKSQDLVAWMGSSATCEWAAVLLESQEPKDFCAPVTPESYMENRVWPLRKYYAGFALWISTVRGVLNVVLVLCLTVGAGLGASGLTLWIPVALALATFAMMLIQWLVPSEVMTAVNSAMTSLNNIDLKWQGSDIKENRSEATKLHLITATEKLCNAVAVTYSGAPLMMEEYDAEDFNDACSKYSVRCLAVGTRG